MKKVTFENNKSEGNSSEFYDEIYFDSDDSEYGEGNTGKKYFLF